MPAQLTTVRSGLPEATAVATAAETLAGSVTSASTYVTPAGASPAFSMLPARSRAKTLAPASASAVAVGWALARYAFEFDWNPAPWVPLAGTVVGALLALAAGWWGLRGVLRRPVVQTLRQAAE